MTTRDRGSQLHLVLGWALLAACSGSDDASETHDSASAADAATENPDTTEVTEHDNADADGEAAPSESGSEATQQASGSPKMPCAVATAVVANCQKCHGAAPAFGAPMPLVTYADLMAPSKTDPSITVAQASLKRLKDTQAPMPPSGEISGDDKQTLATWLEGGAEPAQPEDVKGCYTGAPTHDAAYYTDGLPAIEGETCYDLPAHQAQTADDAEPYSVRTGEHYEQFYFKVPWGPDTVMTRFGTKFDNIQVVHHWLLFTTARPESAHGTHETTIGTTIGDESELIGGWAVGGDHVVFPENMGLELPASGMLNAQWHYYNQGSEPATDASKIQICTVPRAKRKDIASLTFLGTENFNGFFGMPPKTESKYGGTCQNRTSEPITVWGFTPHMHKLGRNMNVTVTRMDGTIETVFDKAFDFNSQITYEMKPPIVLQPGDKITSTCTFNNDTNASVAFGPSTTEEMCYNFTMAYPAHALDSGNFSLIGAKNVCW
ncbi:MAG: hypothetical protein ABW321_35915 [Polyangiales bacterium]